MGVTVADLREQCLAAWTDRRADETRAASSVLAACGGQWLPSFNANPYRYSQDGRCVRCGGALVLIAQQRDERQRDWCECRACGHQQGVVIGGAEVSR
jgi:hypothetical protein